jgi:hypothetical protein
MEMFILINLTLLIFVNMDNFKHILNRIKTQLDEVNYDNGDMSDIGNEIGVVLGEFITTESELQDFIHGIRHGISLTNGTH